MIVVVCALCQELVEDGEYSGRLIETGSDAVVCMEETVDASVVADGFSAHTYTADEEMKTEAASSLDTVHQTGLVMSSYTTVIRLST